MSADADSVVERPRIAIIGGGLAGIAAAVALRDAAFPIPPEITLYEARSQLGGRAGSFVDSQTGTSLDLCQHVSLGCCTAFQAFIKRVGIDDEFRRERTLHFLGPGGELCRMSATPLLPAPLHLASSLLRLRYLSWNERWKIGRTLLKLWRLNDKSQLETYTIGDFLRGCGESARSRELFWMPVVVSALSETLHRASLSAARKVFVDAFLTTRDGYEMLVPRRPLAKMLSERVVPFLAQERIDVRLGCGVRRVVGKAGSVTAIELTDGTRRDVDAVVLAIPWPKVAETIDPALHDDLPWLPDLARIPAAAIVSVHLWYDRPLTELPHVVLPGRVSQWVFCGGAGERCSGEAEEQVKGEEWGYQVVISAADDLLSWPRERFVATVDAELRAALKAAAETKLVRSQVITAQRAVFAPHPVTNALRPAQKTAVRGLTLAGDWTATGWPATMESAVRSGELATMAIQNDLRLADAPGVEASK